MLVLLPPSETKRPGGSGDPLRLAELAFPGLGPLRAEAIGALAELARRPEEMARILKLSQRQLGEIDINASVSDSATLPAVDRFTGVLYDALDAGSLAGDARAWLSENAAIQTALFGPVGALDPIPAFRLSAGHRLPGLAPLKRHWAAATSAELQGCGPVLDLRSEAYRALGPVPAGEDQAYVRVVNGDGRALNHFNKQTKGVFARALALAGERFGTVDAIVEWARSAGFVISREGDELLLTEESTVPDAEIFAIAGRSR